MMKKNSLKGSPIFFGFILAVIVAGMELAFGKIIPQAYGFCTVCHSRDLISWIVNKFGTFQMDSPDFALYALVLTPIGLILGSFTAAKRNSEFKIIKISNPLLMILYGFIVACVGLLIMSCPTRIILRVAYGDTFGIIAALGLFLGIAAAVLVLKRKS